MRKERILPLIVLCALLAETPGIFAKEKAEKRPPAPPEQTHKLDKMEVTTNPFAYWGISTLSQGSLLMKLGGAPKVVYVFAVDVGSPAHKAGIQACDKILALNGVPISEISYRDYSKRFDNTERGEQVSFQLKNPVTGAERIVEIEVKSNKSWRRQDDSAAWDCWGVQVVVAASGKSEKPVVNFCISPDAKRIAGWRTVEIKSREKKKDSGEPVKTEQVPIHAHRRAVVLTWAGKSLALIERENRVVELIEATKVPESDAVVGRLLGEGAVLTLKLDGTHELAAIEPSPDALAMKPAEIKAKAEPVKTSDVVPATLAEAAAGDAMLEKTTGGLTPAVAKWNRSVDPFCIAGNLYYVGASGVASYLITTPEGHILIDSGFSETVSHIEANMKKLGFRLEDIRLLLISHGHYDHVGGMAELKKRTKARLLAHPAERPLLMSGGAGDFAFGDRYRYAPVEPDGELRDGEVVKLGGVELTAHFTPGHTKGTTSWTTTVQADGREYHVVIAASMSAPEYKLVGNTAYASIIDDYRTSFEKLRALRCDIFLSLHGWDFGLDKKIAARAGKPEVDPFVDPEGYRRFIDKAEAALQKQIEEQRKPKP